MASYDSPFSSSALINIGLLHLCCSVLLNSGMAEAASAGSSTDNDPCLEGQWIKSALYFAATLETFSRGFALGFGIRMMKFTWVDGKDISWRERVQVSSESGIAVAAMVHGSALFLPHSVRDRWFDY